MFFRSLFSGFVLAALVMATGSAQAGRPGSVGREGPLPHVCKGGMKVGFACTDDSQCPKSTCEVNFLYGPGTAFPAEITLIVDDNVGKFDGTEQVPDVVA